MAEYNREVVATETPCTKVGATGVCSCVRSTFCLATVFSRKWKHRALIERVLTGFSIELPDGPRRVARDNIAFLGVAPRGWLATREGGEGAFALLLREKLTDAASITCQSDAYALWRVSGPSVRDALAKLIPVDLHPRAF